jgi:hypothetical protein
MAGMEIVTGECSPHEPAEGTLYTRTGIPVPKIGAAPSWPVDAVCRLCERPITRAFLLPVRPGGEWTLKYAPEDNGVTGLRVSRP